MILDLVVNGQPYTVSVERVAREPHQYRVAWAGHTRLVDARSVDRSVLSLILLDRGAASYEVRCVENGTRGEVTLQWRDGVARVTLGGGPASGDGPSGEAGAAGAQRIVAPMPGKVVRVLVRPGDEVAARQGLVVVEAMKMENELASPRAGRVKEIAVEPGASVETGRLLIVVE